MAWMFILLGLVSLTGQILLLREVLVIFHGTEIAVGIFFGSWLMGIGIGASAGARFVGSSTDREFLEIFLHSLSALGFSLLFQVVLIRMTPLMFGASPAELAPLHGILVAVPCGTFSTAFLTGFLFPVGCRALQQVEGRTIGRLYALEALGGLVGGLLFTFALARWLPPLSTASLLVMLLALGALVFGMRRDVKKIRISAIPLLLTGVLLLSPLGEYFADWTVRMRWEGLHPGLRLLVSKPTPYQQVEIAQLGNQRSLFGNGKIVASFPDPHTANRLAAMILAETPEAKSMLLIGGGIGSLVRALLHYPLNRLDVVEPDPWALRIAKAHMIPEEFDALEDSRVRVIIGDGRFHVNRLKQGKYDAIVCMVPDPVSSFWNRYYTREFFQAVSKALAPGGIFVTGVTSAENFWGSEVASYAGSVYHTLKEVFPFVRGTPGDETLFFASKAPGVVSLNPEVLKARYATLGTDAFDPVGFETLLPPERTRFVAKELERTPILTNTDFEPLSTSLAMILWGRFSGTSHMEFLNTVRRAGVKAYLIPFMLFLLARICFRARWGPRGGSEARFQVLLAMAVIGAAAMGLQIVLIYSYQSLFGYIFERIGLIAGIFMAGLVAGGLAAAQVVQRVRRNSLAIALTLALFALLCLVCPLWLKRLVSAQPWQIEVALSSMVGLSGLLTGAAFSLVAARHLEIGGNAGETSGWTDASDHFGAAVGALIAGTLMVPLLGIDKSSLVLALALSVPAILIVSEFPMARLDRLFETYRGRGTMSFPYPRLTWMLIFSVIAAFAWHVWVGPPGGPPLVRFPPQTLKAVSGSEVFAFKEAPFPHYKGRSPGEEGFTISLSTMPPAGDIRGYGGPINLLLCVSNHGVIRGAVLVESRETPSYIKNIDAWLKRLQGLSIQDPLAEEIDAMTGATITSKAIVKIISVTGEKIGTPLLGLPSTDKASASTSVDLSAVRDVRVWAVILLIAGFIYSFHVPSRPLRLACLAASSVVLGIWLNAPFTALDAAGLLQGHIPAPGTLWRNILLAGVLLISLLWGQAFCGFLCPFGAVQEFVSVRKLRVRASQGLEQAGRYLKYVVLAALLCLFFVTEDTVWFGFSPLQHFFGRHAADFFLVRLDLWIMGLCVVVLIASIFYFRFWCRYLCPAGAFLALFNKITLLRKRSPQTVPGRCDLGVQHPRDVDCIRCHRCLHTASTESARQG